MRTDLDSMNPGKAVAQGAHAANTFTWRMEAGKQLSKDQMDWGHAQSGIPFELIRKMYEDWSQSTGQGFGTTVTLDVNGDLLHKVVEAVNSVSELSMVAEVIHDPSYPLCDGEVTHLIPLDTCGYVFGDKEELSVLLGQFDLMY